MGTVTPPMGTVTPTGTLTPHGDAEPPPHEDADPSRLPQQRMASGTAQNRPSIFHCENSLSQGGGHTGDPQHSLWGCLLKSPE